MSRWPALAVGRGRASLGAGRQPRTAAGAARRGVRPRGSRTPARAGGGRPGASGLGAGHQITKQFSRDPLGGSRWAQS